ncbi:Glutamine synthetase [Sebaldella termitidis]|uniref:Glutamine synthetase catalytic region n=2 Tax=Sebaldella TaxID=32068 RepID=D1AL52_SEBTE|nr:glutamine synthetase catalytic region [Sebaldella termitidis ATCC 33386]SUI24515.1 Glutamine synthetase [Sebaldella termitidis]
METMENKMKLFGENAFTDKNLKKRVPKDVFKEFKLSQTGEVELSLASAEVIANALKDWAIKRGATHYSHWFQPLTELTAEKHDSFLDPSSDEEIIYRFSGKSLIKGEPDASSFPNGGLRSTFEARGYTVWDTSSPPFIKENKNGATLYIPTAFISYNGEALDKKVPLLRSMSAVNKHALRILRALGNTTAKNVVCTLGVEQEYFLIKREFFEKREDLLLTGRTLFGAPAPKGQELNDHYFGKIKEKVINFMSDLDAELWTVGISSKTRHNEVAPNQFEIASLFSLANQASDQNQVIMETIEKVALRHDLVALLHEKPFAGVNGSGKHNNWSLATDDGENLLEPGYSPERNLQFLLFLSAVIEAVDRYYPLLRVTTASATNDHRLGGHEAPPAIISVFLGDPLTSALEFVALNKDSLREAIENLEMGIESLPKLPLDSGDRNRTSPFAFTGNKFEFRMPGSSSTPATTAASINIIVSKVLSEYADKLENSNDIEKAVISIITDAYKKHNRIIFNGDGYSEEWHKEAEKRGLSNIIAASDSLSTFLDEEITQICEEMKILSRTELESRYNAYAERYVTQLSIESKTLIEIANKDIIPAAIKYANILADNIEKTSKIYTGMTTVQEDLLKVVLENITVIKTGITCLESKLFELNKINSISEQLAFAHDEFLKGLNDLREPCDTLEKIIDRNIWPMPTYKDLLFFL